MRSLVPFIYLLSLLLCDGLKLLQFLPTIPQRASMFPHRRLRPSSRCCFSHFSPAASAPIISSCFRKIWRAPRRSFRDPGGKCPRCEVSAPSRHKHTELAFTGPPADWLIDWLCIYGCLHALQSAHWIRAMTLNRHAAEAITVVNGKTPNQFHWSHLKVRQDRDGGPPGTKQRNNGVERPEDPFLSSSESEDGKTNEKNPRKQSRRVRIVWGAPSEPPVQQVSLSCSENTSPFPIRTDPRRPADDEITGEAAEPTAASALTQLHLHGRIFNPVNAVSASLWLYLDLR